jgi:hypothetical protein
MISEVSRACCAIMPAGTGLGRVPRFAMHSFPLDDNEDAFYLSEVASNVQDLQIRDRLAQQFAAERSDSALPPPGEEQHLFEFQVQAAMLTRTIGHGDPEPQHTIWRAT